MGLYLGSNPVRVITDGMYDPMVPDFTDVKAPYQEGMACSKGNVYAESRNGISHIYIEPKLLAAGDVVRVRGIDFSKGWPSCPRLVRFSSSDGSYVDEHNTYAELQNYTSRDNVAAVFSYIWDASTYTYTYMLNGTYAGPCKIGFSGQIADGYTVDDIVITINEEITYHEELHHTGRRTILGSGT